MSDFIYGKNSVIAALKKNPKRISKIFIFENIKPDVFSEINDLCKKNKIVINKKPRDFLDKLTQNSNNQGIVAETNFFNFISLEEILKNDKEQKVILILDKIEDPHNFGAIVRIAECAGVSGIIIPKKHSSAVSGGAFKAAAGALEYVPIICVSNLVNAVEELKKQKFWIVGADADASKNYSELDYDFNVGLIIGSEGFGISHILKSKCDFLVKIPMKGNINSLNASVSCGIIVYEILKN